MPVQTQILTRRDTAANWTSTNPTLGNGEWGFETDTGLTKIGDGSTSWINLSYFLPPFAGHAKMLSGRYIFPHWYQGLGTTSTTLGNHWAVPIIIPNTVTITSLNMDVTASAAAGGVARLGIYASDSNNQPSTLILDAGTVATDSTGVKELVVSQTLKAGVYWLSAAWQGNVTGFQYRYVTGIAPYVHSTSQFSTGQIFPSAYVSASGLITGTLPSTFPSMLASIAGPAMWIKT